MQIKKHLYNPISLYTHMAQATNSNERNGVNTKEMATLFTSEGFKGSLEELQNEVWARMLMEAVGFLTNGKRKEAYQIITKVRNDILSTVFPNYKPYKRRGRYFYSSSNNRGA